MVQPPQRARPPGWPIVVAGAGPASLAFALALSRAAGPAVAVAVLDPGLAAERPDGRAFALSPGARTLLGSLGLGPALEPHLQPLAAMVLTDGRAEDRLRQEYLSFEARPESGGEPLGYMVAAESLRDVLLAACREAGIALVPDAVESFAAQTHGPLALALASGDSRRAALLVAADGSRSRLREAAGIDWVGRRYRQIGLTGAVRHPEDHRGRAIQHFLPGGPFAILPLRDAPGETGHRSSIVWTEGEAEARRVLALPLAAQEAELARRFAGAWGEPSLTEPLRGFTLAIGMARSFVGPRLALLGDAAHEIHPLAGQGLNLGLADAAALAEAVVDAVRLGLDPGGAEVLAAYERARRFDAVTLAGTTDALNRIFSNDALPLRVLRDLGLGLVDRSPAAKGFFATQAAGATPRAPRLMRGEVL